MPNPVWRLYIQRKMPRWLAYVRAQPSLGLVSAAVDQYVIEHPQVSAKSVQKDDFFRKFFLDEQFLEELNEQGKCVAAKVTVKDILEELGPYAQKFSEIRWVYSVVRKHYKWCESNLQLIKKQYLQVAR